MYTYMNILYAVGDVALCRFLSISIRSWLLDVFQRPTWNCIWRAATLAQLEKCGPELWPLWGLPQNVNRDSGKSRCSLRPTTCLPWVLFLRWLTICPWSTARHCNRSQVTCF